MKEPLTGDALSRRVAEILGWDSMPNIAHNDHLANTTVKEWCGDDVGRHGMFGDNHHFEVEQDLEFDSSSGPIDTWWLWLSVEKDSNLLNFAFPSPAHAIKAAEGLIRALRGDE